MEPTIHKAELASGAVVRGDRIDLDDAVNHRKSGENVVVCGDDRKANRMIARKIEEQVGPYVFQLPHTISAGPKALPHFQQKDGLRKGHTFYETPNRRSIGRSP